MIDPMASQIDITVPVEGNPTTESVRENFRVARDEISSLQVAGPFLPISGGTLSGPLTVGGTLLLAVDPVQPLEAATKRYVDANSGGGGNYLPLSGGTLNGDLTI